MGTNTDGTGKIMIDLKPNRWISRDVQAEKIRPGYLESDFVKYYSAEHDRWLLVKVIQTDGTGSIKIDFKPDTWISRDEQAEIIRPNYFKSDLVVVYSATHKGWLPATIINTDCTGRIMIDLLP